MKPNKNIKNNFKNTNINKRNINKHKNLNKKKHRHNNVKRNNNINYKSYEEQYIMQTHARLKAKRTRRRNRILFKIFSMSAISIIILVSAYFSLGMFFKVEHIIVVGKSRYTQRQIINASGIQKYKNMFAYNLKDLERNVEKTLAYAEDIAIQRILPNTIKIIAKEANKLCAVENGGKYTIISEKQKILEQKVLTIEKNLDIILGIRLETQTLCQEIKDADIIKKLNTFMKLKNNIKKANLNNIKKYNLENLQNIKFYCGNNNIIIVSFGNAEQLEYKVGFLAEMLNGSIDENILGEIDLTNLLRLNKAIWRPVIKNIKIKENINRNVVNKSNKTVGAA